MPVGGVFAMRIETDLLEVLDTALGLQGRAKQFVADTPLLGALPELDSMSMLNLIGAIEERFGFLIADDEIDGSLFATVGSLTTFVRQRTAN
jgi:acyl carrier protein